MIMQVFLFSVKETRREPILSAKCPSFGAFADRLSDVIIKRPLTNRLGSGLGTSDGSIKDPEKLNHFTDCTEVITPILKCGFI